jgi:hypothetical protein
MLSLIDLKLFFSLEFRNHPVYCVVTICIYIHCSYPISIAAQTSIKIVHRIAVSFRLLKNERQYYILLYTILPKARYILNKTIKYPYIILLF